jgi:hypothetical protein
MEITPCDDYMMKKVGIGLLALVLTAGAGEVVYNGINEGWFFRACDKSYAFVKDNAPQKMREFINKHPVYTAGLEGLAAGFGAGIGATLAGLAIYNRRKRST